MGGILDINGFLVELFQCLGRSRTDNILVVMRHPLFGIEIFIKFRIALECPKIRTLDRHQNQAVPKTKSDSQNNPKAIPKYLCYLG